MKLTEVWLRDPVRDDSSTPHTRLVETAGYTLSLEQGIVSIGHKTMANGRLVPVSNVVFATPSPAVKK